MEGLIQLSYLPTHSQLADVLTKILPSQQHWSLLRKLGMLPHPKLEGGCWRQQDQQQITTRCSALASQQQQGNNRMLGKQNLGKVS